MSDLSKETFELTLVIGEASRFSQESLTTIIGGEGLWLPVDEKCSPGLAFDVDQETHDLTLSPTAEDIYLLTLSNENGDEATFSVEGVVPEIGDDSPYEFTEEEPVAESSVVETAEEEVEQVEESVEVIEEPGVEPEPDPIPEPPVYTPPVEASVYNPDGEAKALAATTKKQLEEYASKMSDKAMITQRDAIRHQTKLLSIILTALSYGGRKTEMCMQVILEEMSDKEKMKSVFSPILLNRFVYETFRVPSKRNLFIDLCTVLTTAASVGRKEIGKHVNFRKLERLFSDQRQYANLCTFFSVKD